MNYGIIAIKEGLFMVSLPSDFDIQMISDEDFENILTREDLRVKSVTQKAIVNLIDEAGDLMMNRDYKKIIKLQNHESDMLLMG